MAWCRRHLPKDQLEGCTCVSEVLNSLSASLTRQQHLLRMAEADQANAVQRARNEMELEKDAEIRQLRARKDKLADTRSKKDRELAEWKDAHEQQKKYVAQQKQHASDQKLLAEEQKKLAADLVSQVQELQQARADLLDQLYRTQEDCKRAEQNAQQLSQQVNKVG